MTKKDVKVELGKFDIYIIGAGISGSVLANKYATLQNKKVLIIDTRDHIGGNCFDYVNGDGVLVSKYGAHLFHTNYEDVWEYLQNFSTWYKYEHKVKSMVDGQLVPIPVNIETVNLIFKLNIKNEGEMKLWFDKNIKKIESPVNSEESALNRVGPVLYEKMFKNYTIKQWDIEPKDLEAAVMDRIPVRSNFDDRYFNDSLQYLPTDGYTPIFNKMLENENITVLTNTKWEDIQAFINPDYEKIFFTGKIDSFFEDKLGKLEYRSLKFEFETFDKEYFQKYGVINYPESNIPYTRIVEYKHFTKQKLSKTTISKEYSTWEGDPYYPVPTQKNRDLFDKYKKLANDLEKNNIYFVGRLANYKYFNMDQAFKNALDLYSELSKKL